MFNYRRLKGRVAIVLALILLFAALPVPTSAQNSAMYVEEETKVVGDEYYENISPNSSIGKDDSNTLETTISSTRATPVISNGVYAIQNRNTTSYARCNTVSGGTYLSQQTFTSPPASEANRHAMFKIIYRSSTNDYVIRNMVNNEVVIYANVGYNAPLSIKLQNVSDTSVPSEKAWEITETSDGYYNISCTLNGTTYYMYMPESGNLELTTTRTLSGAKWSFNQYTGSTFRGWGQIGEWPKHIENGSSATIEAYIYSTVVGENSAKFRLSAVDPDVATVSHSTYTSQMTITPKYGGNTKIQIESNTSAVFGYHYLMSGWDNGCFFIQNSHSSNYLTVSDTSEATYLTLTLLPNGSQKEYTLWKFVHWGGEYYWINQDITGETIHGNNDTSSNLTMQPYAENTYIQNLWRFIPQSDGTIKIQSYYHATNNPNNYISLHEVLGGDRIRSLADTGDKQLWLIEPLKFNISVLYDKAFVQRHSSVGHINVLNDVFLTNSAGTSIASNMLNRLGFHTSIEYTSTSSNTYLSRPYLQECSLSGDSNINHICNNNNGTLPYNCSNTSTANQLANCQAGYHHKNGNSILAEISSVDRTTSTSARILFTGFNCCNIAYGVHTPSSFVVGGWATGNMTKCLVMPSSSNIRRTAQHELTHILGATDCSTTESPNCIMGKNQTLDSVVNDMVLCDSCMNTIKALKYTFYNH